MKFESMGGTEIDLSQISAPTFDALYASLQERTTWEHAYKLAAIRRELAWLDDHIKGYGRVDE